MNRRVRVGIAVWLLGLAGLFAGGATEGVSLFKELSASSANLRSAQQWVLACRAYAADAEGAWPESLEALVPEYMDVLPPDGFDYYDWKTEASLPWDYFKPDERFPAAEATVLRSPQPVNGRWMVIRADGGFHWEDE